MWTEGRTPGEVYNERVASGELTRDQHQETVVAALEGLHTRLKKYEPARLRQSPLTPLKRVIFGADRATAKIPRGIYIWGTVGGGKTM